MAVDCAAPVRRPHAPKGSRPRSRGAAGRRSRTAAGRAGNGQPIGGRAETRPLSAIAPVGRLPRPRGRSAATYHRHRQPQCGLAVRWRRHFADRGRAPRRAARRLASNRDPPRAPRADRIRDRAARSRDSLGGERRVRLFDRSRRGKRPAGSHGRRLLDDFVVEHVGSATRGRPREHRIPAPGRRAPLLSGRRRTTPVRRSPLG